MVCLLKLFEICVGVFEVDFYVVKYDIVDKVKDLVFCVCYGLDEYNVCYDKVFVDMGSGVFDVVIIKLLMDDFVDILVWMENDNFDYLIGFYIKDVKKLVLEIMVVVVRDIDENMLMLECMDVDGVNIKFIVEMSVDFDLKIMYKVEGGKDKVYELIYE